jgi:hypothetical protein
VRRLDRSLASAIDLHCEHISVVEKDSDYDPGQVNHHLQGILVFLHKISNIHGRHLVNIKSGSRYFRTRTILLVRIIKIIMVQLIVV